MTDTNSDQQGESSGIQIGSIYIGPIEYRFLKLATDTDSSWLGGENGRSFSLELGWEADEVDADEELTIINQPNTETRVQEDET